MASRPLSVRELWNKWRKERSFYEQSEVGTGVQVFVKDVLKSPEVFALRVGLNSTTLQEREYEFLEERTSKGSRRPDVTVFVSPEIVIPVEVERYKNIEAGKAQLLLYQSDLDKKYGILTDGYTWRFYNNNIYSEQNLKDILQNTDKFLEFWREYTKPEKYYLSFFEEQGQLSLLKGAHELPVEENRQLFFEDMTKLISSFTLKLDIEGYLKQLPEKEKSKRAIEITYAYIIQFVLYKTLVDNEFDDFRSKYKSLVRKIHEYLQTDRFKDVLGCIEGISTKISKNIYRPFSEEQEFITQTVIDLYHKPSNELHDVSPWLDIFIFIKKYSFADVRNEIFGYIYENYLTALYEQQKKGQYFTDPAVVNFMLDQVGYIPRAIRKRLDDDRDKISLVDPSCGSGTFLYSAVNTIIRAFGDDSKQTAKRIENLVNKNIFGLDIGEFPLYLAEMNILMRMLPLIVNEKYNNPVDKKIKVFKTRDSIAEFMDTSLRIHDIGAAAQKHKGQEFFAFEKELDIGYSSYVRDERDLEEMKRSLEQRPRCPRRRFDFVIGNPPYVGYNECSTQGIPVFGLLKKKEVKLNDVYGVNLHSIPSRQKKYAPKPNLYAFFIALGLALLKDNGKLCYIIPQTVLTASDLDVVRYHLAKFTTIEKIIILTGKMFVGRGIKQNKPVTTSSLIFVARRALPRNSHKVKINYYEDPNDQIEACLQNISKGRKVRKTTVPQKTLLERVENWNFIKHPKAILDFMDKYDQNTQDIAVYYNHNLAERQFQSRFYIDGGGKINDHLISRDSDCGYEIFDYKKNDYDRLTISPGREYYPRNGDITFPHGSQGVVTFQQECKIIWRTKNPVRFQFCDRELLLVNNQSLVISSNNREEIVYLLCLLNSRVNRLILEKNLFQKNEQAFLVAITPIKTFVRVPQIRQDNQHIKKEIVKRAEEMLRFEAIKLGDLVDFSAVMRQRFDTLSVKGNNLVLCKDGKESKLRLKTKKSLAQKTLLEWYSSSELKLSQREILLSELRSLPVIDVEKQSALSHYVDDLVFALYFHIPLPNIGLNNAREINQTCRKSRFYKVLASSSEFSGDTR